MDKIQCIKHKGGFLVLNLDTLLYKLVSAKQMRLALSDINYMAELVAQLDGEPFQKRLAPYQEDELISVHLMPTYACNYRCSYCYQRERKQITGHMTPEYIPKIEDFYAEYNKAFKTSYKINSVSVTGGEPFLPANRGIIGAILSLWKDKTVGFITNGAYVNYYRDLLLQHKSISLLFSVDGTKEIHYKKRIPSNADDYDVMLEGITWALSEGIETRITCLFYPEYIDSYPLFFDELAKRGWPDDPNFRVRFGLELHGAGSDAIDPTYLEDALTAFISLKKRDPRMQNVDTSSLLPGATELEAALKCAEANKTFYTGRCDAIIKPSYAFTPEGYVKVCSCVEGERGTVGQYWPEVEINVPRIKEVQKRRFDQLAACEKCVKRVFCMGGCFATALAETGDLLGTHCGIWENPTFLKHLEDYWSL
ncbi:MAG TPA: radical SAM protein [Clostridia bacterium]|nr:radical SAM protein [Clostridia bacterium]